MVMVEFVGEGRDVGMFALARESCEVTVHMWPLLLRHCPNEKVDAVCRPEDNDVFGKD
jgi:hypothetical protein